MEHPVQLAPLDAHRYLHELAARLVKERSSKFCIEALRVSNMVRNHRLARSILDRGARADVLDYVDVSPCVGGAVACV